MVELLASTAIMLIVMLVLLQVIAGMTNIWHTSTGTISTFQSARAAFTTLTRTLSRATLKTYIDYVDASGNPVTNSTVNSSTFVPIASFTRSSELSFLCGPTIQMITSGLGGKSFTSPSDVRTDFPGDIVTFQAPLGMVNSGIAAAAPDKFLQRSLNTVGFYATYSQFANTGTLPNWLTAALGLTVGAGQVSPPRFRLMEYIEPTENVHIYNDTLPPAPIPPAAWPANGADYYASITYIPTNIKTSNGMIQSTFQTVTLAENVVLLIIRPRLEPPDEQALAGLGPPVGVLNALTPYSVTTANSIISPNYNYDSRAWWGGAMGVSPAFTMDPTISPRITNSVYARLMRNQLPPILDVAMVAVDPNTILRFPYTAGPPLQPPTQLQVPATMTGTTPIRHFAYATQINPAYPTSFSGSANMDVDLNNYGLWLSDNNIRYRIFRSSVQMEGAAWVNSY